MSTTIDQRVVEMRFDNQHFEKNVATTMSTLDKLKQKLHLDGATKGLQDVNSAAGKVNMNGLGSAVESVSAKFSALQVMGVTALANITNSAVNAGKNIIKSLTIDPIKTGFSEYETKMGSIQTILANTEHQGTTLDDVTAALEELNLYADKTIYNFQQMTKNIGTFTAAGVDLETSTRSIQGIANLAAVSGSTSQQASTAMYQLSQALSAGTVKLMDWNSVVNAGMGGKVFQNALIRTAAMLDGAADDVEAWQKKHIDAHGSFRESLSKEQWLTAEVLTTTLEQFTMAAEEGSEEWNEFKKSLMAQGYAESQAEEILKMANTATDAATKVKTFTQLLDTLKESAQSGWAQTWELIVGDFEEAKAFFTELSDMFGGILGKSADRRNTLLGGALKSNWDKLISKINEAGIETSKFEERIRNIVGDNELDKIIEEFGSLEKAVREGGISSDILKKALDSISGTGADGKLNAFVDGLKEIERMLSRGSVGEDVKKLQTALDALGYDLGTFGVDGIIGPVTEKAIKAFQEANGLIVDGIAGPKTLAALEKAGEKVENINGEVDGLVDSCGDLIDVITEKSGRELLLDSLMNVIKAIQRPLSAVGEAFRNIFSVSSTQLYKALEGLNKFTKKLVPKGVLDHKTWDSLTEKIESIGLTATEFELQLKEVLQSHGIDVDELIKKYGGLGEAFEEGAISFDYIKEALLGFEGITESLIEGGETADKVRRTFEGLFALFDIIGTVLAGPIKIGFKVLTEVLGQLGLTILDFTAGVGDKIVDFRNNIDGAISAITKFLVDNVSEWIKAFKETEFFKTVAKWFTDAGDSISGAFDKITEKIKGFNASAIGTGLTAIVGFFKSIGTAIGESEWFGKIVDGFTSAFDKLKTFFSKFKIPEFNIDNLKTFSSDLVKIGEKIAGAGGKGFTGAITGFGQHIKDNVISWDWTVFKETALEKVVNFFLKTGDKIKKAFEIAKNAFKAIKEFLFGTEEVNLPTIIDLVTKVLWLVTLVSAIKLMNTMVSPLDNISDALDNLAASRKWESMASAFKAMGLALLAFTACIIVLTQMPDMNKAWHAVGMLATLMIVMGGIVTLMGWIATKVDGGLNAMGAVASLLMMIGSIVILVHTLKQLDELELKHPGKTIATMIGVILAMTAGVRLISKAGGSSFRSVAAILTLMAALKLVLEVLDAYAEYPWAGKAKAIGKMVEMMLYLSLAIRIMSGGTKAGASSAGLALAIIAMVASLKIILDVIKDLNNFSDEEIKRGGAIVAAMLGALTLMISVVNLTSKGATVLQKGERSVNHFTGLALALLAVVAAIWLLGKMDYKTLMQGGAAVGQVLLSFTVMLGILGLACKGLKIGSIVTMLIMMAVIIAELAIVVKVLEDVPWQNTVGAIGAIAMVLLALAGVCRTISKNSWVSAKDIWKWVAVFAALTILIGALAFVLYSMKDINWSSALGGAAGIGIVLLAMSGAMNILMNKCYVTAKEIWKWVAGLAGLTVIVGALAFILYKMDGIDGPNAVANAAALSLLLIAMSGAMAACAFMGKIAKGAFGNMMGSVLAIGALGLIVGLLGQMLSLLNGKGIGGMIPDVLALSGLMLVLTVVMAACALMGKVIGANPNGMFACVGAIIALGVVVGELGLFLSWIKKWDMSGMESEVMVLAGLLMVLTVVMAACAAIGLISSFSAGGMFICIGAIAVLGAVVLELGAFLAIIKMFDIGGMMPEVKVLSHMLIALTVVMAACAVIGFVALPAIAGAAILLVFVGALMELIVGLGRLMSNPELSKFLDTGIESLKRLARGIGEVITEFGVGLTSGLPEIGQNLTDFSDNLSGFVSVMNSVDDGIAEKASTLATAILTLTAGDLLNKFTSLFNKDGESSLATLGSELSGFADNASGFITAMSGLKPESAGALETFVNSMVSINELCRKNNFGDGGLESFGTSAAGFAESMKDVAGSLEGLTDEDVANIQRSATAAEALSDLNKHLPRQGGVWQDLIGEKDLATWGAKISTFADSLIAYSDKITGKPLDTEAITKSAEAAAAISDLNDKIPTAGGAWQEWAGEQNLASWGSTIVQFADCLVQYSSKIAGASIDSEAIKNSAEAIGALADVNAALPKSGGDWQSFWGEKNLTTFGVGLTSLADGIVSYASAATFIDESKIESIKMTGTAVDEIMLVIDKLPKTGGAAGWLGEKDPNAFGTGINALATGIATCCNVAASIGDQTEKITNLGTAVDNLKAVVDKVPETTDTEKMSAFTTAVNNIHSVCATLNLISTSGYDYSGIETLKSNIEKIGSIITGMNSQDNISPTNMKVQFGYLSDALVNANGCATIMSDLTGMTYGGIDSFKAAIERLASTNVDGVISAFDGKAERMKTAVSNMVKAITTGFSGGATDISDAMTDAISAGLKAIDSKGDSAEKAGAGLAGRLVSGLDSEDTRQKSSNAGKSLGSQASDGAKDKYKSMKSAGMYLGDGLVAGITAKSDDVWDAAYTLGALAVAAEKEGQQSESPSKATIQAGKWLGEGLVIGMDRMGSAVYEAGRSMGSEGVRSISNSISKISGLVESGMDAQPTIRPVLDLSDVQSGISAIGGMFGSSSIGVNANLGTISNMMNQRSQNGVNDDVISAINGLRRDIANVNNTTYQINGITYDDGSNVSSAVQQLVRAARIERRV